MVNGQEENPAENNQNGTDGGPTEDQHVREDEELLEFTGLCLTDKPWELYSRRLNHDPNETPDRTYYGIIAEMIKQYSETPKHAFNSLKTVEGLVTFDEQLEEVVGFGLDKNSFKAIMEALAK
ncbi:hypothetical protein Pmar_PMAR015089 [Perkinsus marinus ATCC 50983]|uniref:Uncharacterized protein n=1 Tax=Perkinsus marinus (strain ATCC 50983 / TXsc) TaxID=423536 RepID=C5KWH2_PERM5|nr:hypothetical protein Pmar_PMAR015089 [Perkinsus marinus ATCC 50983]EER11167.1 hypothetical protein Pmar_PMAR015089 [Perkinsus marinus ATCC 50983]|eukprot:XP_002779372.1 hypothetical protein Pmar_PMAR015089 [Perkinsus marinus ATCC 50983]